MAILVQAFTIISIVKMTNALNNGLAITPPMGFNTYMAGCRGTRENCMQDTADFFVGAGLHNNGYTYVNTDEGWELRQRSRTGELQFDPAQFPSGLPTFIKKLHSMGLKFGIYGAASGVTCGNMPGQTYHEMQDAQTYAKWGVDFLKSDNCASYALDPSVRFGAMRDALNMSGAQILLSIEPFSITPDPEQSVKVANMWRCTKDICGQGCAYDRADITDKWAPLAGPGGWNDPDMIQITNNVNDAHTYFGLWVLMKAPLLLSSNLSALSPDTVAIINNSAIIAVNQDTLGVAARKLWAGNSAVPWLVGLEPCDRRPDIFYSRKFAHPPGPLTAAAPDTRVWKAVAKAEVTLGQRTSDSGQYQLTNLATGRCLAASTGGADAVVLVPCNNSDNNQLWTFDKGPTTITSVTNVGKGQALAVSNTSLYGTQHTHANGGRHGPQDAYPVPDAAYGEPGLLLVPPYDQANCGRRDCQNYDPSQMWYYEPTTGLMRHSLYVASINHGLGVDQANSYELTDKVPTYQHHCLAHVLSTGNRGTAAADTEVWGGPLAGGSFVMALVNRDKSPHTIRAEWAMLEIGSVGPDSKFKVTNLWTGGSVTTTNGGFSDSVGAGDLLMYRLDPM